MENYTPALGDELLYATRQLLDAWDRKASIIRTADRPGFHRFHAQARERLGQPDGVIFPVLDKVRAHIRENGATTAKSLGMPGKAAWGFGVGNWGSPNLGRVALEAMLLWGKLAIAHKPGGRKAYDFASRLLPAEIVNQPDPHPSGESYAEWRVLRRVAAAGLIWQGQSAAWMGPAVLLPQARHAAASRLLHRGELMPVRVEGVKLPFLARPEDWARYEAKGFGTDDRLRFIAPLDNLMWDRPQVSALFGFEYHWEVYDPPQKRQFGYYVLPILAGDELVGRVEPVFKKEDAAMRVKGIWWEEGAKTRKFSRGAMRQALEDYARFLVAKEYGVEAGAKDSIDAEV